MTIGPPAVLGDPGSRRRRRRLSAYRRAAEHDTDGPRRETGRAGRWEAMQRFAYLALGLALGALQAWLLSSEAMPVREVAVYGNRLLPTAEAQAQLDVAGRPILWLRRDELAARLRMLPEVASVEVEVFAPGIVEVSIVERQPALLWAVAGERWLVDDQGMVLRRAVGDWPALPVVYQVVEQHWQRGHHLDPHVVGDALRLGHFVRRSFEPGTRLIYHPQVGLAVAGKSWQALFDPGGDLQQQRAALLALMERKDLVGEGGAVYDLRFPGRAYVRALPAAASQQAERDGS